MAPDPEKDSIYSPVFVKALFNRMSRSYERMNVIMSFGQFVVGGAMHGDQEAQVGELLDVRHRAQVAEALLLRFQVLRFGVSATVCLDTPPL